MWNSKVQQQTRPGIQNGQKFNPGEVNSWSDLMDNGYLDRQFRQMNFNGVGTHPARMVAPVRQPPGAPVPLMSVITSPPPHLVSPPSNGLLSRHPPPPQAPQMMAAPPRQRFPRGGNSNGFSVRQPQRMNGTGPTMPMIDTSIPPPRLPHFQPRPVIMQRPPPQVASAPSNAAKPSGPLTNTDLSAPFSTAPAVKVVGEDEHRTQYVAPGPKVKILKRPSR